MSLPTNCVIAPGGSAPFLSLIACTYCLCFLLYAPTALLLAFHAIIGANSFLRQAGGSMRAKTRTMATIIEAGLDTAKFRKTSPSHFWRRVDQQKQPNKQKQTCRTPQKHRAGSNATQLPGLFGTDGDGGRQDKADSTESANPHQYRVVTLYVTGLWGTIVSTIAYGYCKIRLRPLYE